MICHPCILGGRQKRGTKSELAALAMPSRGPKTGQKCYVTPAFSGVPNKGEQNQNWLPEPCLLGGPKVGGSAMSPLHSRGSPTKGNKIRIGCLSHAFSGAEKWAEVLCHPCILGGPQQRGTKSELAASAMPFRDPKGGQKCSVTPAFSGVPHKGEQTQNWLPWACLLGGRKVGGSTTWAPSDECARTAPTVRTQCIEVLPSVPELMPQTSSSGASPSSRGAEALGTVWGPGTDGAVNAGGAPGTRSPPPPPPVARAQH